MQEWVRWLLVGVLLGAYMLAIPARVAACSCGPYPTPQEALADADVVFVGEAVQVVPDGDSEYAGNLTTFEVSMLWKGPPFSRLTLETGRGDGDCGSTFEVGQQYLVYGHKDYGGDLVAGICSRTTSFERAQEDLLVLGVGQASPPPIFEPTSPFNGLGTISGLSSASLWGFFWAHQGHIREEQLLLFLAGGFLVYRGWRWWRS